MTTTPSAPGTLADDEAGEAHRYANRLALALFEQHYSDKPRFELLPNLYGVLMQIDNMTTGLTRKATTNAVQPQAVDVTGEAVAQIAKTYAAKAWGHSEGVIEHYILMALQQVSATRPAASGDGGGEVERLTRALDRQINIAANEEHYKNEARAALASMTAERDRLAAEWKTAYLAFKGAFDTPVSRRRQNDEYAVDARNRLRAFDAALASPQADAGERG